MSPALFVLAALVATPEGADAPIAYQVKVLEMEGLGWRAAHAERLRRIERPGIGAIWTGDRDAGRALAKASGRLVSETKVAARPEATAEVVRGGTGPIEAFVGRLSGHGEGENHDPMAIPVGFEPSADPKESLHVELTGRRLDQGTLASVEIESTWVSAIHPLAAPACCDEDAACTAHAKPSAAEFVPEVAHARVVGEWLIPGDGVLVVSLGAHSSPSVEDKLVVRERLAVIEIVPADPHTSADACPAEGPVARPTNLPPLPEDIDLRPAQDEACRVAEGHGTRHADASKDDAAPPEEAPRPTKVVEKAGALPMPSLPGRSLPQGFTPDGSPAPPTKQDEDVKPTGGENSAEPLPTPQATPQAAPSARATPAAEGPSRDVPIESLADDVRPLPLTEAIRIGILNGSNIGNLRLVAPGVEADPAVMVIAPGPGQDANRLKAEVMAMVRSIEQQYWALAQAHIRRWSKEVAVELGEEISRREQARFEVGGGTVKAPDEAKEQLDHFRQELTAANGEVVHAEHQLRNILGMPTAGGPQLLPTTAPGEDRVEPVWRDCLAAMDANQPEILRARALVRADDEAGPARGELDRAVQRSTHILARFYHAVSGNYREFRAAHQLREAVQQRLEAEQAFYEAGTIPLDRYLDSLEGWSMVVIQEAVSKTTYNTAIAALEEAQGTLLARKGIVVAEAAPGAGKVEAEVKRASLTVPAAPEPKSFCWNIPLVGSSSVNIRVSATHVAREITSPPK